MTDAGEQRIYVTGTFAGYDGSEGDGMIMGVCTLKDNRTSIWIITDQVQELTTRSIEQ